MKPRLREDCLGKWATLGLQGRRLLLSALGVGGAFGGWNVG